MTRHLFLLALLISAAAILNAQRVRVGAEVLIEKHLDVLSGKRVGVVCNHTSVLAGGTHLVDTLLKRGIKVTALFAPEHGIRGDIPAGVTVKADTDSITGLEVYSLYGGTRKPTQQQMENLDVLLFDMQDAGARFYTYASTMSYVMEAAAENGKKFLLLDRPNPINGLAVEGPVLDLRLISFVGLFPIPIRHGLTLGELARMTRGEGFINPSTVDLTVIPMEGWKRSMWYDQTGLPWIAPSPNMKTLQTAAVYPGTCLFEATNISEGRGSEKPFEYIGAPGLNGDTLASRLNAAGLPGVRFRPVEFTPRGDPATGKNPKYKDKLCRGVYIQVTDREKFKPVLTGLRMLEVVKSLYTRKFKVTEGLLDHLAGDEAISKRLGEGRLGSIMDIFRAQIGQYMQIRSKYLLY